MKKKIENLAIIRPLRTLRDLPQSKRDHLLRQMKNYLLNCTYEENRLRTFRDKVNSNS